MPGKLSTHVLDNYHGKPANAVEWSLEILEDDSNWKTLKTGITNEDGRVGEPLLSDETLRTGKYRLSFNLAKYYTVLNVKLPSPPFLDVVTLEVNLIAGESYHVPLAMTPWSYSTYRGS